MCCHHEATEKIDTSRSTTRSIKREMDWCFPLEMHFILSVLNSIISDEHKWRKTTATNFRHTDVRASVNPYIVTSSLRDKCVMSRGRFSKAISWVSFSHVHTQVGVPRPRASSENFVEKCSADLKIPKWPAVSQKKNKILSRSNYEG